MRDVIALVQANWLEIVAVSFGVVSVFLSVRQNVLSWPTAIVNVLLFFALFRTARLYADMWLQLVYFAFSIFGWYEWLYGGKDHTVLRVSRATPQLMLLLLGVGGVTAGGLGIYFERNTNAALPYLDSLLTSASLVAQFLMTRKVLENWLLWIAADVVYVGMFIYKQLYLTAGQYALFLVLAVMGYAQWKASYEADRAVSAMPGQP